MPGKIALVLFICITCSRLIDLKDIEDIATCFNETDCNELSQSDAYTESPGESKGTILKESFNLSTMPTFDVTTNLTKPTVTSTIENETGTTTVTSTEVASTPSTKEYKKQTIQRIHSDICECDMTVFSCDINCCCDVDCMESHLSVFSGCQDSHAELYDRRYCYNFNFIERNNTPFILEKLANNLFCILYDNLPPTYSTNNDLVIHNRQQLNAVMNPNELGWFFKHDQNLPEYSVAKPYQDGAIILKLQGKNVQPLAVPQTGFTRLCSFKKTLQYLRNWKDSCIQTNLTNANTYLYTQTFNNFSVIASPHLFNKTYMLLNEVCPKNVCLSIISYYCRNKWTHCNNITTVTGACSNGICQNIVRGVKYVIIHNGSFGINNVSIYFDIGNVSKSFYQHFEVTYRWVDFENEKVFSLSGNPGYIHGKPILIGRLSVNKTNNVELRHVSFNKSDCFFTLPVSEKNGECSFTKKHLLTFGENIKLKCRLSMKINNFSTSSCVDLQNRTMQLLLNYSLINVTQMNEYNVYVSKLGNITDNATSSWIQILFDKIPQNVVTGQIINGQLHCSSLLTSMQVDILYSTLSKPETLTNHNILGFGITLSDNDISWPKCIVENCTDVLHADITTYVTFHDVSKPSKYYFVGAPNLDVTLPYDFFFPFLPNSAGCFHHKVIVIISLTYSIFFKVRL